MKNLKNVTLKKELVALLPNIVTITKNEFDISKKFSIDVIEAEPISKSSYMYNSESERDEDFEIVNEELKAYKTKQTSL